jgi:hypothetical protein
LSVWFAEGEAGGGPARHKNFLAAAGAPQRSETRREDNILSRSGIRLLDAAMSANGPCDERKGSVNDFLSRFA